MRYGRVNQKLRPRRRAFRPGFDHELEPRFLLATTPTGLRAYGAKHAPHYTPPPHSIITQIGAQTAHGGQSVVVTSLSGAHFVISLTATTGLPGVSPPLNTGQPTAVGTVRAYPMGNGAVGLIVDGTSDQSVLNINLQAFPKQKNFAHTFSTAAGGRSPYLDIGAISITSGRIAQIDGFHTANLEGPLTVGSTAVVDRIAFNSILPGGSIQVGGNLNTLDILTNATLTTLPGIATGGDLNLLNVGGNLTISNGAALNIGRDAGLTLQAPKGTGTGSNFLTINIPTLTNTISAVTPAPALSAYIQGNLNIGSGSALQINRRVDNIFLVQGQVNVNPGGNFVVPPPPQTFFATSLNTLTFAVPANTIVALGGFNGISPPLLPPALPIIT
jgi:hypothetical protein